MAVAAHRAVTTQRITGHLACDVQSCLCDCLTMAWPWIRPAVPSAVAYRHMRCG